MIWKIEKEKTIGQLIDKYQGAKVFRGKRLDEIITFTRMVAQLEKSAERDIIMWSLNKRAGRWKKCAKCGQDAFKEHMEECILDLQEDDPNLDKRIKNAKNLKVLQSIAKDIKEIQRWVKMR